MNSLRLYLSTILEKFPVNSLPLRRQFDAGVFEEFDTAFGAKSVGERRGGVLGDVSFDLESLRYEQVHPSFNGLFSANNMDVEMGIAEQAK